MLSRLGLARAQSIDLYMGSRIPNLLERLADAEEQPSARFPSAAVELHAIVEPQKEPGRAQPESGTGGLPDIGDAEIGNVRIAIA